MHIALRADAGSGIGVGHVMRSTTLGEGLIAAGARVTLCSHGLPPALAERAASRGIELREAPADADAAVGELAGLAADLICLDGYHLRPLLAALAAAKLPAPVAVIDDNAELAHPPVALVLNQNLHATDALYEGRLGDAAALHLGCRYALIRSELRAAAGAAGLPRSPQPRAERLLVSLGGADPANQREVAAERNCGTEHGEIRQ